MRRFSLFTWGIILIGLTIFTSCQKETITADYNVIPLPQRIEMKDGSPFMIKKSTVIVFQQGNEKLKKTAGFLAEYILYSTGLSLSVTDEERQEDAIVLKTNFANANSEAYKISVDHSHVIINGSSEAGTFYGVQTLRKSMTAETKDRNVLLPAVEITDYPRFAYRGMMLDVARHFYSVEFVKKYIDILALHNLNRFHWHLSDDQGWRIEIKKRPLLTEVGSKRKETLIGLLYDKPQQYDGKPYGGFYTQEEIKEVVKYAEERSITVIPEIDLPGHMLAALTAYPELGCTGGPYEVATKWGVFDDVLCVGNDEVFNFLEDVFSEIVELFPSKYIHVGGDECPKTKWKTCPKCQARAKALGLKADKDHSVENKLQSYCISRVEKFLNSKGREIIGWDEILEGGLAPNATVMSWRGTEGGIAAARLHHDAIMTPHYNLYFDYYQSEDKANEPLTIGGYVPIEKVYNYEPVPEILSDEEKKYIIGVQANMWTEYRNTDEGIEYMVLPRIAALSEIQWTMPEKKNYVFFLSRLGNLFSFYTKAGYNTAKHVYEVYAKIDKDRDNKSMSVTLASVGNSPIYYTLDGTEPTKNSVQYSEPILISTDTQLKAIALHPDYKSKVYTKDFIYNKATLSSVSLLTNPNPKYTYTGAALLTDGFRGGVNYDDGTWVGFSGNGMQAVVDLGTGKEISSVRVGTLVNTTEWIFGATGIVVEVSDDNKVFQRIAQKTYLVVPVDFKPQPVNTNISFDQVKTRYVKITVENTRDIPSWHDGKGQKAMLFVDEIEIN